DYLLPPDDGPGGAALGAVDFIERTVSAFACTPPAIYAAGPFSGRTPFATNRGEVGDAFPRDAFAQFLPLDRVAEAAWRIRLFGAEVAPSGEWVEGLSPLLRRGLAAAMEAAPAPLPTLPSDAVERLWQDLDPLFRQAFTELCIEAAFAAPEYGGNRGG